MKPDSKILDERNVDEMLVKMLTFVLYCSTFIRNKLFEGAYFALWFYFERLKFGDLIPIYQFVKVSGLRYHLLHHHCGHEKHICRHGIPDVVVTDNRPQYASKEFAQFAESYGFTHGNGKAEHAIGTVKSLLKDCSDPYLALLLYRSTPLPYLLLMGQHLHSLIPTLTEPLAPNWPDLNKFQEVDEQYKLKLKKQYDRRHRVLELPVLDNQVPVYISSGRSTSAIPGSVVRSAGKWLYEVQAPTRISRHNRSHLYNRPIDKTRSN